MRVSNLLEIKGKEVFQISENDTVADALRKLADHDIGALLVLDKKDKITGIFSERDFARKILKETKGLKSVKVKEMMTKTVFFVKPDNTLWDCLEIMSSKRTRHLAVIESHQLIGIVSIGDIVNRIITEQRSHIDNLENYIVGSDYGSQIDMNS